MFTKRMLICVIAGALLGIVCIVGAQLRTGFEHEAPYLFAFWFNRLLLGIVIGLAAFKLSTIQTLGRGALLGLLVSFAFYSSTGFQDVIGFIAGIIYGVIIEYAALKLDKKTA
ncbi:MAG: hypothetical protein WC970_05675 [Dehalococcoidales bacterium]|jgi:formate/nitrite transporter FocA (FNT family)